MSARRRTFLVPENATYPSISATRRSRPASLSAWDRDGRWTSAANDLAMRSTSVHSSGVRDGSRRDRRAVCEGKSVLSSLHSDLGAWRVTHSCACSGPEAWPVGEPAREKLGQVVQLAGTKQIGATPHNL